MKLHATVVEIRSGSQYTDGKQRITLKVKEADQFSATFSFPKDEDYLFWLDQTIELELKVPVRQDVAIQASIEKLVNDK